MEQYRRRKMWIRIAVICALVLLIAGAGVYIAKTYKIESITVVGSTHYTNEEIQEIVMRGPLGHNSLYLSFLYRNRGVENVPFVDMMDVQILSPTAIQITVYEKALAGFVKYMGTLMYFDKDGYVVESSSVRTAGVPQIVGLQFEKIILGEQLEVADTDVFGDILTLTKLLGKYELAADKLFFQSSGEVSLFFGNVRVDLGDDPENVEDKLMRLPELLNRLEAVSPSAKGTFDMRKAPKDTKQYIFYPDEEVSEP